MQRWIKELENESCSGSVEDGTESTSSQQSTSSRSTPNPLSTGMYTTTAQCLQALTLCKVTHPFMSWNRRAQHTVKEAPRQIHSGDDTSTFGPPPSPPVAHHAADPWGPPPSAPPQPLRRPPPQRPDLFAHALAVRQPLQHAPAVWSKETTSSSQ